MEIVPLGSEVRSHSSEGRGGWGWGSGSELWWGGWGGGTSDPWPPWGVLGQAFWVSELVLAQIEAGGIES